jgi:hypothetical protein
MSTEQAARAARKKRRAVLVTIMALGAVVSLTAVNGVFAIFTDRATTGTNTASSRAEARSADLQIATASYDTATGETSCGQYDEDLVTGIISVTNLASGGFENGTGNLCLKNVGSRTLDLSASVIDLVDTDPACTGDEATIDVDGCGPGEVGELSGALRVIVLRSYCDAPLSPVGNSRVAAMTVTPLPIDALGPGQATCVQMIVDYLPSSGDELTGAQSDTSTWRFAFDGTA